VLDALKEGLKVFILTDDIAGVNKQQQESSIALEEMVNSAAKETTSEDLLDKPPVIAPPK
jgi:nicotinamidase-related amidase